MKQQRMNDAMDRHAEQDLADFWPLRRAAREQGSTHKPKQIGNVIAQLMQRKGYARIRSVEGREKAWQTVLREQQLGTWGESTRVVGLRRGILEVQVETSLLLHELTFHKEQLLTGLQQMLPDEGVKQIRFRVASIRAKRNP